MFPTPNGFSQANARFQIIHIQTLKFMRILISLVTISTAQNLRSVTHSSCFLFHNPFYFELYKCGRKLFYLLLDFGSGYFMDSTGNISFSDNITRCLHWSFPCHVPLNWAGKVIVFVDFGLKKKKKTNYKRHLRREVIQYFCQNKIISFFPEPHDLFAIK